MGEAMGIKAEGTTSSGDTGVPEQQDKVVRNNLAD